MHCPYVSPLDESLNEAPPRAGGRGSTGFERRGEKSFSPRGVVWLAEGRSDTSCVPGEYLELAWSCARSSWSRMCGCSIMIKKASVHSLFVERREDPPGGDFGLFSGRRSVSSGCAAALVHIPAGPVAI